MSEPTRWRDDGPDDVRALLRAGPRARPMTGEQRARTTARVRRLAAIGAAVGGLAWLQGAAFGAALGVVTVTVGHLAFGWFASPPATPILEPLPAPTPTASILQPARAVEPTEAPLPSASAPPRDLSPRPASSAPTAQPTASQDPPTSRPRVDSLAQEAALLERARGALGSSPAEALALAERHAAEFPTGELSVEREIVIVDALRRQGRAAEARARGEAVRARARGSLYEDRLRKLLEGL